MNAIESLLNAANRAHEVSAVYVRKADGIIRSVRVTRETGELAPYTADDTPQTYRTVTFSADESALGAVPQRGDLLTIGTETFRVVERDGVTYQRRFETWGTRILFFTERVEGVSIAANRVDGDLTVSGNIIAANYPLPFDGTITQNLLGQWGVDANFLEVFLERTVSVAVGRGDRRYLRQSLLPYPEWDQTAEYEAGDVVFENGELYEATAPNLGKEPFAYFEGAAAVWKKILFSTAAFATTCAEILPTGGFANPTGEEEALSEVPTVQAVIDYVERATSGSGSAPVETRTIVGDGITRVFTLDFDGDASRLAVYDARGRRCCLAYDRDAAGKTALVFAEPPASGEIFTLIN